MRTCPAFDARAVFQRLGVIGPMDSLVLCEYCRHGATLHSGDGCASLRCQCRQTRETIVTAALLDAKREIHDAYRVPQQF